MSSSCSSGTGSRCCGCSGGSEPPRDPHVNAAALSGFQRESQPQTPRAAAAPARSCCCWSQRWERSHGQRRRVGFVSAGLGLGERAGETLERNWGVFFIFSVKCFGSDSLAVSPSRSRCGGLGGRMRLFPERGREAAQPKGELCSNVIYYFFPAPEESRSCCVRAGSVFQVSC